jgi:hypothetical protein
VTDTSGGADPRPTDPRPTVAPAGAPGDNASLVAILAGLALDGYTGQFEPVGDGDVRCTTCDKSVPAGDISVEFRRRLEGASDPDDMATVIAGRCPNCGSGATLVLGYGVNASDAEVAVGRALRGVRPW